MTLSVPGRPGGTSGWRRHVAAAAATTGLGARLRLDFTLRPGHWVDLDTLAEATLRGLADAGAVPARFAGLDGIVATKIHAGDGHGVRIRDAHPADFRPPGGKPAFRAEAPVYPRPGDHDAKRAWRAVVAAAHGTAPPLEGPLWARVHLGAAGSLLTPLEVVLDALEPVLGRDPRGRAWQEFFPRDDLIVWLGVRRTAPGDGVRLELGVAGNS